MSGGDIAGLLIRQARLGRDWSQARLCLGICAPSYLSKIEQGKAAPSPEVTELLLRRLGLVWTSEPESLEPCWKALLSGSPDFAACYERLGFRVVPPAAEARHDIIQAVELGSREGMIAFCKGIQSAAPVDSYVTPEPSPMPGYDSDVIMAAGAFVQGSSIELSADGPTRPPYAVYFQGGLTWYHAKLGILMSLQKMQDAGLISL